MNFTITTDFKKFISFDNPIRLLQRIGNILKRNIIARTQFQNVDPNNVKFEKYSKGYANYKNKHGGSGSIVNLKSVLPVGEHMVISTEIVSISNKSVEVGVTGRNLKKAMYNENMDRMFLGISKEDEKDIDKIINDYADEELRKL